MGRGSGDSRVTGSTLIAAYRCPIEKSLFTVARQRPLYVALFSSSVDRTAPFQPVTAEPDQHPATMPHGLDREVAVALPALWYILHLPSSFLDVVDLPCMAIDRLRTLQPGHAILLAPTEVDAAQLQPWAHGRLRPTLVVAPSNLINHARRISTQLDCLLPPVSSSELTDETLAKHWAAIHRQLLPTARYIGGTPRLIDRLDLAPIELPVRRLAHQMRQSLDDLPRGDDDPRRWLELAWTQHALVRALAKLEADGRTEQDAQHALPQMLLGEQQVARMPVTIGAPGVASSYVRNVPQSLQVLQQRLDIHDPRDIFSVDFLNRDDDLVERATLELLVTHNAVRGGIGFTLPSIPPALFSAFSNLEQHWANGPDSRKVDRLLKQLDAVAAPLWRDDVVAAIHRASHLTVFSNFPIGVLRLPGDTAPLSCRISTSYRPILPLTRALQVELGGRSADLSGGFHVLVAECIPATDPVGRLSRRGWDVAEELFHSSTLHHSTLARVDVGSIDELRSEIRNANADVLLLSAHGFSDGRVAGVVVGDEQCIGPELGPMPPVVVLSACHVSPRGRGSVNITDLLLREGAVAILGTHVPVDVLRNATLMVRLFVYMTESIAGAEHHATLVDAWTRTQATNAVMDILYGNQRLTRWGRSMTPKGVPVLVDFMNNTSVGRLRPNHIYEDSERVLMEMAQETGVESRVKTWLRSPGYVPESAFYAFIGAPERVVLRKPVWFSPSGGLDNAPM